MAETNWEDKRSSKRVPVDLEATISKGGDSFKGVIINCSLNGMFLRTTQKLELSDIITISVLLPNQPNPLMVRSTVIWTDWNPGNPGFGVHFVTIPDEHAETLKEYLY
jgi:Tfp pilus assembly protein PilZ